MINEKDRTGNEKLTKHLRDEYFPLKMNISS